MIKIILPFPPSVNSAYGQRGQTQRFKSRKYKDWLDICPELSERVTEYPVHLYLMLYYPDNRDRDNSNYIKLTEDFLVKQNVITDDSRKYCRATTARDGGTDKENPRVEVYIYHDDKKEIILHD